ncbi:SGNH/GDSL hydrolase family protein [Limoniibacter endophyticus]|nr:DUF459 domain-containing protein [Limoniibacter endophyticus]
MAKIFLVTFVALTIAAMADIAAPVLGTAPAYAQDGSGPRNFFRRLFGGPGREPIYREDFAPQRPQRAQPRQRTQPPRNRSAPRSAAPRPPATPVVEKREDAKKVLVIGDFMAGGLVSGLNALYAENPGVRIVGSTQGSSGLVRDDYYDWPKELQTIVEHEKPAALVIMLGANDRQDMQGPGGSHARGTEGWTRAYEQRAERIGQIARTTNVPLVWVGLPSFRISGANPDILALNDLYRDAAAETGAEFVDIWEGFVDENGSFVMEGPDMNGQPARLRGADGINLTEAGKRKVAFYAKAPLDRLLGNGVGTGVSAPVAAAQPARPQNRAIERLAPVSLYDPAFEAKELMGETVTIGPEIRGESATEKFLFDGIAADAPEGRADHFQRRG